MEVEEEEEEPERKRPCKFDYSAFKEIITRGIIIIIITIIIRCTGNVPKITRAMQISDSFIAILLQ